MDENDKKDLEEAVEKVINEREERKKALMGKPPAPTKKKNLVKEASSPVKKNKFNRTVLICLIVIVGLLALMVWLTITPSIMQEETEVIVYPANVVLDSFDDRVFRAALYVAPIGNDPWWHPVTGIVDPINYVSVTFELKNTGDEVASDVSCFIKCCDQNGAILFAQLFTFGDIEPDRVGNIPSFIPVSYSYRVPISDETLYVTHSIDVQWSPQGVNTYMQLTEV